MHCTHTFPLLLPTLSPSFSVQLKPMLEGIDSIEAFRARMKELLPDEKPCGAKENKSVPKEAKKEPEAIEA